jgi:hypothetical protein
MPKTIRKLILQTLFTSHPLLNGNGFRSISHFGDKMIYLSYHILFGAAAGEGFPFRLWASLVSVRKMVLGSKQVANDMNAYC